MKLIFSNWITLCPGSHLLGLPIAHCPLPQFGELPGKAQFVPILHPHSSRSPEDLSTARLASGSKYLDLLKKYLVDYAQVNAYEYHPLHLVRPTWKTALLKPLDRFLRWRNFAICKRKFVREDQRVNGADWPLRAWTMIGLKRLDHLQECIQTLLQENILGDLMETGVWRGGAGIFMRAALEEGGDQTRKVWLADSFAGLPPPDGQQYPPDQGNQLHQEPLLGASRAEVEAHFRHFDLLDERTCFLEGWFKNTLPGAPVEQLALLRLDADLYESTALALEHLYPKLSPGGFLIVDDYHAFSYCQQAVEDYRAQHQIEAPIIDIDREAVFWRKP